MSDLYLDLRRRIPVVADWTDVGTEAMEEAQSRTGLSDERLAREIPVSAKTWVRWKRRGQIPTHLLPKVAPLLGFEMVPLEPVRIAVPDAVPSEWVFTNDLRESLATMVALLQRIAEISERSEGALGRIERAIAAPGQAPARAKRKAS
jgi:hypothetical protein